MGDDGQALRGLQGRGGPAVLPRSFLAARSPGRAGRCARGVQRRTGSAGRPRGGAGGNSRLFPDRPQHAALSSLFRPRIDRILFAATKADHLHHSSHDRLEAVLRRTVAKAVARAEIHRRRDRRGGAGRGARHPRGARCSAAGKNCPRSWARLPPAKSPTARPSTARPRSRPFRAICRPIPKQLFSGEGAFRGLSSAAAEKTDFRFLRFRPPQLEATAPMARCCLTSALTAPSSS